jgi:hypothetical protein
MVKHTINTYDDVYLQVPDAPFNFELSADRKYLLVAHGYRKVSFKLLVTHASNLKNLA